jgi:hypothetical protein
VKLKKGIDVNYKSKAGTEYTTMYNKEIISTYVDNTYITEQIMRNMVFSFRLVLQLTKYIRGITIEIDFFISPNREKVYGTIYFFYKNKIFSKKISADPTDFFKIVYKIIRRIVDYNYLDNIYVTVDIKEYFL